MSKLPYIALYVDDLKAVRSLKDAELGRLVRALLQYNASGEEKELSGNEAVIFPMFIARIDRDAENYSKKCKIQSENAKKRWNKDATASHGMPWHQEKEKEEYSLSLTTRAHESSETVETVEKEDEPWRYAMYTLCISQKIAMTREQFDYLADRISRDDLAHYLDVVETCAEDDRPFTDPCAAIMKMAKKDGKLQ